MTTTVKFKMNVVRLVNKAESMAESLVNEKGEDLYQDTDKLITEFANKLENTKQYRTKDFEDALDCLAHRVREIVKDNGVIDKASLKINDYAGTIIIRAKQKRDSMRTYQMEINTALGNPFFTALTEQQKKLQHEQGVAEVIKRGPRTIEYYNPYGYFLTEFDKKVFQILTSLWREQGKGQTFTFTEYQILQRLDMSVRGGLQYKMVRKSLLALSTTQIVIRDFYEKSKGSRIVTDKFYLVASERTIEDFDEKDTLKSREYRMQLADFFTKSMEQGYTTDINFGILDSLNSTTAREIYQLLCAVRDMSGEEKKKYVVSPDAYDVSVDEICEYLHLVNKDFKNRHTIIKACDEMKRVNVIEDYLKLTSEGRTFNAIRFMPGPLLKNLKLKTLPESFLNH